VDEQPPPSVPHHRPLFVFHPGPGMPHPPLLGHPPFFVACFFFPAQFCLPIPTPCFVSLRPPFVSASGRSNLPYSYERSFEKTTPAILHIFFLSLFILPVSPSSQPSPYFRQKPNLTISSTWRSRSFLPGFQTQVYLLAPPSGQRLYLINEDPSFGAHSPLFNHRKVVADAVSHLRKAAALNGFPFVPSGPRALPEDASFSCPSRGWVEASCSFPFTGNSFLRHRPIASPLSSHSDCRSNWLSESLLSTVLMS